MSPSRAPALCLALLVLLACDEGSPRDVGGGSGTTGDAQAGGSDGSGSASGDGGGDGDSSTGADGGNGDGGSTGGDGGGSASGDGGSADGGTSGDGGTTGPYRDPSTITGIRKPTVKCGDTECEGTTQVCCDHWTADGWDEPACMEKSECSTPAGPFAAENDVRSECDGPADCQTGSSDDPVVCCFLLQAAPHFDLVGTRLPGPGFGRECLKSSACLIEDRDDIQASEGAPQGLVSCTEDADCDDVGDGMSCEPESMDDPSAGQISPRPHVSLCK